MQKVFSLVKKLNFTESAQLWSLVTKKRQFRGRCLCRHQGCRVGLFEAKNNKFGLFLNRLASAD